MDLSYFWKHDFNTEVFKIGETEEGRNILGLHVGDKNHSSDKPKVRTTSDANS